MSDRSRLVPLVEDLARARVLCVGDVMLDHFHYGTVERISPEAPIPVLRVETENAMLGGAGNVVRNLVSLGVDVRFVTVVGNDNAGMEVERQFRDHGIPTDSLFRENDRRTSTKSRYLAAGHQMLRADTESLHPISEEVRRKLLDVASREMSKCDVLALADYGKGVLAAETTKELIVAATEAGRPIIIDPKGDDFERYRGADVITPNLRELEIATRMPVRTTDEILSAARHLIERHDVDAILATRGQDGMTLLTATGDATHLRAEAREVFDVSGAGDTVVATLSAALGVDAMLVDAAAVSNVAAGIVVGKVGTAVVTREEIVRALHHHDLSDAEAKILGLPTALAQIERWRQKGLSIGFTNGCFDLLHPGHVVLLDKADKACDRLVVGLNSDASVTRLKGPDRPIQSEAARGAVLASLASVDAVVIFSEDTPQSLIEAIRPDVLIKGADYALEEIVGASFVQSHGGRVLRVDLEPGHSTTATIERLAKGAG